MHNIVTPFYVKNTSCLENLLCMILSSEYNDLNADHKKLFIDHWYMNYDSSCDELGDRIKFFNNYMINQLFHNVEVYYGIKAKQQKIDGEFQYEKIAEILNKNDYVILCIDAFELKNLALYKKHHVEHYVLVKGIEKQGLRCIDYSDEILLDIEHYNAGVLHYQVLNSYSKKIHKIWPSELYEKLTKIVNDREVFKKIRLLGDSLKDTEKLYIELNNVSKDDVLILRIPNSLQAIAASRYHIKRAIGNIENIPLTAKLADDEFSEIEQEWSGLIKRIIKFKFNHKEEVITSVRSDIYKLADREEKLAQSLLNMLEKELKYSDR